MASSQHVLVAVCAFVAGAYGQAKPQISVTGQTMSMMADDVMFSLAGGQTVSAASTFSDVGAVLSTSQAQGAQQRMLQALIRDTSAPYHWIGCGNPANPACLPEVGTPNGELHEVSCCSDTAITGWAQPAGCPYVSRRDAPLQCNASGEFQNSFSCGVGGDAQCNHNATFEQAWRYCYAAGARLCTLNEIQGGCTAGIGCGHDADMMWTASVSPPAPPPPIVASDAQVQGLLSQIAVTENVNHFVACGSGRYTECGTNTMSADNREFHEVACCSDSPLVGFVKRNPSPTVSCPYASRGAGGTTSLVCSSSGDWVNSQDCGVTANTVNCNYNATYMQAVQYCTAAGARLCTADEILDQCTTTLGCGHDADMLWSSTSVPRADIVTPVSAIVDAVARNSGSSHYVACGAQNQIATCGTRFTTAFNEEQHEVSCCSDAEIPNFVKRSTVCPWAGRMVAPLTCSTDYPFANSQECGTGGDIRCNHNATYAQAMLYCAQAGARLCTREEILNQCTRGLGCGHDADLLWTSTPSPPPVPAMGHIACGSAHRLAECASNISIVSTTELHDVSCCSDVPLGDFQTKDGCPYAARHQKPLECRLRGANPNSNQCGSGAGADLPDCNHQATLAQAKMMCEEVGARLCTLDEVVTNQCTIGLGCNHDGDMIWTADDV